MEYTKQTWTAPTGTGLSRYAKSAESASHVTLTLDPENLTNTPTPFTAERMAHIEEGIAKAYDTAPPTPWAQYSGKDIPQLPDNVAGTTYKRDNDWTTTDGWTPGHPSSTTLSVEYETLKVVYDGTRPNTGVNITRSISANGKFIKGHIKGTVPINDVQYYSDTAYVPLTLVTPNAYETDFYGYMQTMSTSIILVINFEQVTAKTCWLESLYIGTGAYDRLVFDNSYHYRHLLNNAVVPTPQGLYFNGATSYLRSKDKVTLPDVFTFSATVNCAVKSDSQFIFSYNPNPVTGEGLIGFYIASNSTTIQSVHRNSSGSSVFTNIGVNALTAGTDVLVEIETNFTTKAFKIYKNNVLFNSGSLTDIVKPPEAIYDIGASNFDYHFLGYMRNICIFDTALTDTQRNWLAQGNTPPILYDVTNWLALETLRYNTSFLLQPYPDGKKLRIANTHASNTITVTMPSGYTMNGQSSFTIIAGKVVELELIGTSWVDLNNDYYSTTEQIIGTWIDGKPLYRKVVDFGALPNATIKGTAHGITNLKLVTKIYGIALPPDNVYAYPIPSARSNAIIGLWKDNILVGIETYTDLSGLRAYITLEYTKTTD